MTDAELKQLAVDISEGKVFGSWMLPPERAQDLMHVVFMPLALGADKTIQEADVWGVYQYTDKATRTTKDGFPLFMSFKILTKEDCAKLAPLLDKLRQLKQEFMSQ
jgi:hypothetical protein